MDDGILSAVTYGDPDDGYAVCLRQYRDPAQFKVELWQDGDIVDQFYGPTLAACHEWLETIETPFGERLGKTVGLAPQSDDGRTFQWVLIDEGRADEWWWEDCDHWAPHHRVFLYFRDMKPEPL